MKKLMIGAAIVLSAVATQAATVSWGSGAVFGPTDSDGTIKFTDATTRLISSSAVTWYVFNGLTADQVSAVNTTAGTAFGYLSEKPTNVKQAGTQTGTNQNGLLTNIDVTQSNGTTDGYAILITYKDESGKDWFLEGATQITTDDIGSKVTKNNNARYAAGNTSAQFSAWSTQSVPEPTSGLLLVLGIAGLALRRRRA